MSRFVHWVGITLLVAAVALGVPVAFGQEEKKEEPPAATPAPATTPEPAETPAPVSAPAPAAPAAAAPSTPVEKAVIELGDKAKSNGEIVFAFTPAGGATQQIRVTVVNKAHANEVAKDIAKEFTVAIGANYQAKDEGGKVKIEGKKKATFGLSIMSQTVTGLSIRIK
jgi:3-oxoacyl-ACP reductase-like protein